jgi:hypothetical protein
VKIFKTKIAAGRPQLGGTIALTIPNVRLHLGTLTIGDLFLYTGCID